MFEDLKRLLRTDSQAPKTEELVTLAKEACALIEDVELAMKGHPNAFDLTKRGLIADNLRSLKHAVSDASYAKDQKKCEDTLRFCIQTMKTTACNLLGMNFEEEEAFPISAADLRFISKSFLQYRKDSQTKETSVLELSDYIRANKITRGLLSLPSPVSDREAAALFADQLSLAAASLSEDFYYLLPLWDEADQDHVSSLLTDKVLGITAGTDQLLKLDASFYRMLDRKKAIILIRTETFRSRSADDLEAFSLLAEETKKLLCFAGSGRISGFPSIRFILPFTGSLLPFYLSLKWNMSEDSFTEGLYFSLSCDTTKEQLALLLSITKKDKLLVGDAGKRICSLLKNEGLDKEVSASTTALLSRAQT